MVALTVLEVLKNQDLPEEVLADEDVSETLPRRLGLSDVVDAQIDRYRKAMRRRRRIPEEEALSLFHLVSRRPDAGELFERVGRRLSGLDDGGGGRVWSLLPGAVGRLVARRRLRRLAARLLGQRNLRFAHEPEGFSGRGFITVRTEPPGDGCALVGGLAESVFGHYSGHPVRFEHVECEARGDVRCRWVIGDG